MPSDLIPVSFRKIMQSRSYTVLVVGTEKKQFAIYTEPNVGRNIQIYLAEEPKTRPYTHDLLNAILKGLDAKILQIVINNVEDTVYFARLFLEQTFDESKQILEIDARPSDCITLSVLGNVPLYCKREVFEKAVPIEE